MIGKECIWIFCQYEDKYERLKSGRADCVIPYTSYVVDLYLL